MEDQPVLKPDAQKPPRTSEVQSDDGGAESFLTNKFAALSVEEPKDIAPTEPTPAGLKKVVDEEDDDEAANPYLNQLFFKTLCLLQDLENIRGCISITLVGISRQENRPYERRCRD